MGSERYTKSKLAIALSKLAVFEDPNVRSEQYPTDPEVAADMLWNLEMIEKVRDKTVIDLGAGTGILGLGAALLGAKRVILVEKDENALKIAQNNLKMVKSETSDVVMYKGHMQDYTEKGDIVVQNPPFGTKKKGEDVSFLEKAFSLAPVVYSFHKTNTRDYIEKVAQKHGFSLTHAFNYQFPLKSTMKFHTRKIHRIAVSCYRFAKGL